MKNKKLEVSQFLLQSNLNQWQFYSPELMLLMVSISIPESTVRIKVYSLFAIHCKYSTIVCTFNEDKGCKNLSATLLKMDWLEYIAGNLFNYEPALFQNTSWLIK